MWKICEKAVLMYLSRQEKLAKSKKKVNFQLKITQVSGILWIQRDNYEVPREVKRVNVFQL